MALAAVSGLITRVDPIISQAASEHDASCLHAGQALSIALKQLHILCERDESPITALKERVLWLEARLATSLLSEPNKHVLQSGLRSLRESCEHRWITLEKLKEQISSLQGQVQAVQIDPSWQGECQRELAYLQVVWEQAEKASAVAKLIPALQCCVGGLEDRSMTDSYELIPHVGELMASIPNREVEPTVNWVKLYLQSPVRNPGEIGIETVLIQFVGRFHDPSAPELEVFRPNLIIEEVQVAATVFNNTEVWFKVSSHLFPDQEEGVKCCLQLHWLEPIPSSALRETHVPMLLWKPQSKLLDSGAIRSSSGYDKKHQ